jgi:hypothetical protein
MVRQRGVKTKTPPAFSADGVLKGSGVGWFGGSIQPRSPLKFTLDILVYAESTLMSKILATVFAFTSF